MDGHTNLQTASTYINNLLLARGLLKNGKSIDFAHPDEEDGSGTDATMARAINLINDLVLRRDVGLYHLKKDYLRRLRKKKLILSSKQQREAEHRESLAATIQSLRTNESNQMVEIVWNHLNYPMPLRSAYKLRKLGEVKNQNIGVISFTRCSRRPRTHFQNNTQ
jgi:hypothetical protein